MRTIWMGLVILGLGCSAINTEKIRDSAGFKPKEERLAEEFGEPVRMAAVWTPDLLTTPGTAPTRGFGGRVFFYNNRNETIPVQGELVVYGYDDTDPSREKKRRADQRFPFSSEKFSSHFSEGELGASYSVWAPWDQHMDQHRIVTLIPVFTTKSGRRIQGAPGKAVLNGQKSEYITLPKPQNAPRAEQNGTSIQQVQHTEKTNAPKSSGLKTTTISLSPNMQRHLRARPHQPTEQKMTPAAREMANNLVRQIQNGEATKNLYLEAASQVVANQPVANQPVANQPVAQNQSASQSPYQLQNHFANQPYGAQVGPFEAGQFNSLPGGGTTRLPPSFRATPQPHVPHFAPRQRPVPTLQGPPTTSARDR
jgi:hypothetical protein